MPMTRKAASWPRPMRSTKPPSIPTIPTATSSRAPIRSNGQRRGPTTPTATALDREDALLRTTRHTYNAKNYELAGRGDADRGEGLVELDEVEVGRGDALLRARLRGRGPPAAAAGWSRGRRPGRARRSRRAAPGRGSSALALLIDRRPRRRRRRSGRRAGGDGAVLENAGRSLPSDSAVVSPRTPSSVEMTTGSPLRCGIETGATSSSKTPFFQAAAAFWCERAANSSCSARVRFSDAALRSSVSIAHGLAGDLVEQRVVRHRVDRASRRRT